MVMRRAFLALTAAMFFVSGCSHSESPTESKGPLASPDEVLKQAAHFTSQQPSVHIILVTHGQVPHMQVSKIDGDLTSTPLVAASGTATVSLGSPSSPPVQLKFVVYDGTLYSAFGSQWQSFGAVDNIYPIGNILDPSRGLAHILSHVKNPVAEGRDVVEGISSERISGTVERSVLEGIYPQVSGDLPATIWVQEEGDHSLTKASIQVTPEATIEMTLTHWGDEVNISKPV